jgi:hypothetical protein
MMFTVANVLYMMSAIDELLYMSEAHHSVEIARVYDQDNNESIALSFPLKNGMSEIKISDRSAVFYYLDRDGKIVICMSFDNEMITDTCGSFHKVFKEIRALDRQQSNLINGPAITLDRALVRFADIN